MSYPNVNPQQIQNGYNNQNMNYPNSAQQQNNFQMSMNYSNDRIVENYDFVKYMQIPVDGRTYYFMKADGTEIYSKRWLPDCTTEIKTFKEATNSGGQIENVENRIIAKLEEMNERISKIEKNISYKSNKNYSNKKFVKEDRNNEPI